MTLTAADWTVDRSTGNIRYVGQDHGMASPSYATVIEFHRWLQGLADDAVASGDDELDITNQNPSSRSTDNIITLLSTYNIDDTASEHLYDGSIIQGDGDEIYDGFVNFGNSEVQIQVIQNGGVLIDDWWNVSGEGLNKDLNAGISHRFMLKVRTGGGDVDGRRVIGICRTFGNTYSEFKVNGTSRGNNVFALSDATDLNNETAVGTVATWSGITNETVGYVGLDIDGNTTDEYYYSEWNRSSYTINQFYERMKWLTRAGSTENMYGISGELFRGITHEINYSGLSGTFDESNPISWSGTASGTGQVLADNGSNKVWIQLLTGTAPVASDTLSQTSPDAASATVSSTTDRSALISKPFVGQSTGTALIGAYGIGLEVADVTAADTLFDLTNNPVYPPNLVTNTVAGLVSEQDRVLVAPWDGVTYDDENNPAIQKDQLSLASTISGENMTAIVVSEAIPDDTPSSGYVRVTDDNGFERRLHYSAWGTSTFTIDTTDGNEDFNVVNATAGNDVYIAYLDELVSGETFLSYQAVYDTARNLVVIVRDGGATPIKEFISGWTFTSSNQTITAIRTTDA